MQILYSLNRCELLLAGFNHLHDVRTIPMAIRHKEMILGSFVVVSHEFEIPNGELLIHILVVLLFPHTNVLSSPLVAVVFSFLVLSVIPIVKDLPNDAQVVFLSYVVFVFFIWVDCFFLIGKRSLEHNVCVLEVVVVLIEPVC